jgi:ATP-dependent RNA helicase RhlE
MISPLRRLITRGVSRTWRTRVRERRRDRLRRFDESKPNLTQFSDFGLAVSLLAALRTEGYEQPTPIQAKAIPPILAGRDLLGLAQTGTGKTAAFALPILDRLIRERRRASPRACRVLVLAPTRELAQQIGQNFRTYGARSKTSVAVVVGGMKFGGQARSLAAGVDVLVATPGRLLDHLAQRNLRLDEVDTLVLDEADQMLDLGFLEPIRKIVRALPSPRQTLFFSATMPKAIGALAAEILVDPVEARVAPVASPAERVAQRVIHVEAARKRDILLEILRAGEATRAIVFTRTKRGADRVAKFVMDAGVEAASIHGDKSQGQRERALAAFKAGRVTTLIATDIAARGIDVEAVSHVVNYELPNVPESYVHRIGRTARAGATGHAITLCDPAELPLLRDIEKLTRLAIPAEDRRAPGARPKPEQEGSSAGPRRARRGNRGARRAQRGQPGRSPAERRPHASAG